VVKARVIHAGNELNIFLEALPDALTNKLMRPLVESLSSEGAKRLKKNLKQVLPKRSKADRWQPTGALMASIGVRRPVKLLAPGVLWGAFGVRRSQSFAKNKLKTVRKRIEKVTKFGFKRVKPGSVSLARAKRSNGPLEIRPSRYAHLVERGTKGPVRSRAYPFLEPTRQEMESVVQSRSTQIIRDKYPKVLAAEGRRLSRKIANSRSKA